jgi:hypothetical protein
MLGNIIEGTSSSDCNVDHYVIRVTGVYIIFTKMRTKIATPEISFNSEAFFPVRWPTLNDVGSDFLTAVVMNVDGSPKRQFTYGLHGTISLKTATFIFSIIF